MKKELLVQKVYNCIVVFNGNKDEVLLCLRKKNPFQGKFNFVGGKVEPGEDPTKAAYRELQEETGITPQQIRLYRLMDICYYHQNFALQIYVGRLDGEINLEEEVNPLCWMSLDVDFNDRHFFAGEQNMAHIINIAKMYPIPDRDYMSEGLFIGVDGCKDGWVAAILDHGEQRIEKYKTIESLMAAYPTFDAFLIDIPIGLVNDPNQNRPDSAAKQDIRERSSSVFPIPCRQAVYAEGEEAQKEENIRILGKSLSKQTTSIIMKIREVDEFLQNHPEYKNKIMESHPEVAFARLNGEVVKFHKQGIFGANLRRFILSEFLGKEFLNGTEEVSKELDCDHADVIDALCMVVTAAMYNHGEYDTLPENPETDETGLIMQMTVPHWREKRHLKETADGEITPV